jgi:hypothetical protein
MNASKRATTISEFTLEISSGSEFVYNNGLSQVRITIIIAADSTLTKDERDSLRLCDADSRQTIPVVDSSVPVPAAWGASTQKNAYDFYPSGATPPTLTPDTKARVQEVFHQYVQTADFAGTRRKFGARITLDAGGDVYSMDTEGSKGEVEIVSSQYPMPSFSAWQMEWDNPDKFEVGSTIKVTVYHLGMTDNGKRYGIRTITVAPQSWASTFRWLSPNSSTGAFCGYAPPPDTQTPQQRFVYSHESSMGDYRPATNNYSRHGCASVAFVSRVGGLPYAGGVNMQGSVYILRDQYGTTHRVRVNIATSLDEMTLTQA